MPSVLIPKLYQVSITTGGTPQKLFPSGTIPAARYIELSAPSTNTSSIFYGDSSLAAANGIELAKGTQRQYVWHDLVGLDALYVVSASTGDKLNILVWGTY